VPVQNAPNSLVLRGGSCMTYWTASFVVEPVFDEETIITAELDLSIDRELMTRCSGHIIIESDVFEFKVNGQREIPE